MRLPGTLRSWNDDRGFGFIAPTHGGVELFVHISALPGDGSRPTVGEKLTYELGRGRNGQPQAVKVQREAIGRSSDWPAARRRPVRAGPPLVARFIGIVLLVALGAFGFSHFKKQLTVSSSPSLPLTSSAEPAAKPAMDTAQAFKCDGRTHCSRMTSCTEAKFFLKNCPGAKMDGNNDGIPCEQQWCTSPFAK